MDIVHNRVCLHELHGFVILRKLMMPASQKFVIVLQSNMHTLHPHFRTCTHTHSQELEPPVLLSMARE